MPMSALWIVLVLAFAALIAGLSLWRKRRLAALAAAQRRRTEDLDTLSSWEPQPTRVLRPGEQLAMVVLSRALPDYVVLAQVPLARFIRVPQRHSYTEWLRRVGQLSPDLLVCDPTTQVLAAVEVSRPNGKVSERASRRLERMRRVLKAAGIPLHIWTEGQLPSTQAAREAILPKEAAESAAAASAAAAATPATKARAMRLSDFDATVPPPPARRPPIITDAVEDAVVLREPPPSTWFDDDDFGPDSELPESIQPSRQMTSR